MADFMANLMDRVEVGDCWMWTGHKKGVGYGYFGSKPAHRWVYENLVGPIPEGMWIDHLCRNPSCVNPDHLEPVTPRENTMRGPTIAARNAAKTRCKNGHKLDEKNTYTPPRTKHRACRTCIRDASRRYKKKADAR